MRTVIGWVAGWGAMAGRVGSQSGKGWLPAEVSSFLDREREIAEVKRLLATARLVTLTGVGGIGKTRLAVRVAREVGRAFADGVWLVDVGPLADGGLLDHAVAATLGVRDNSDRPLRHVLAERLRAAELL